MKRYLFIALLFLAFKASAQNTIPGQEASKYIGQKVSAFGYIYKIERDPASHMLSITFGSKYLMKGVILKLRDQSKLDLDNSPGKLNGCFITVTGKVTRDNKGKPVINGDDPATSISVRPSLAVN